MSHFQTAILVNTTIKYAHCMTQQCETILGLYSSRPTRKVCECSF